MGRFRRAWWRLLDTLLDSWPGRALVAVADWITRKPSPRVTVSASNERAGRNKGQCIGGPLDGSERESAFGYLSTPTSAGKDCYAEAVYRWSDERGAWLYEGVR